MKSSFRRYIAVLLGLCLMLSLCACSGLPLPTTEPQPQPIVTSEPVTSEPVIQEPVSPGAEAPVTPENVVEPEPASPSAPEVFPYVCINEVMAANKACLADISGNFPDWVELYNYGSESADLTGYILRCGGNEWDLPSFVMAPGEYAVIFCSGQESMAGEVHASFSIPKEAATVALASPLGTEFDSFSFTDAADDESLYRNSDGLVCSCAFPSPGFENSPSGYAAFQSTRPCTSPLVIYEVMVYNEWHLFQKEYYDWVQLKNVSGSDLMLNEYYLSDSGSDRAEFQLPAVTLGPGQSYTVYCTGDSSLVLDSANAPFSLNADYDQLFLSYTDGSLCDYVSLHDIPYGGSCGRMDGDNGFFYFTSASPNAANLGGMRSMADKPVLIGRDGVYNGVDSVTVTLSSSGTIRYTTDGSMPTASSPEYTGPFELSATGVVRAVSFCDGMLPSDALTLSYILNENHDLPVVSLVSDPNDMFGHSGVYSNPRQEYERLGSVALYDGANSFTKDCGFKLHGETSKVAQEKKSFKINFRSRYDGELTYDLFGNGITEFSSILIRAAQEDYYSSQMRDNIMHQLAIECCPELPSQDMKYCVLYINGQYWGLYCLREAHSPAHYANHYGYNEDTVEQWKGQWPNESSVNELYNFIRTCKLSDEENYAYISRHIDIDSLIAWSILEAYSGNFDCNASNIRFYYSTEDDMVRYALVDLDLGMFSFDVFDIPFHSGYDFSNIPLWLLNNSDFRSQFLDTLQEYLHGPLSTDHVLELVDSLADQIRSEIPRDRERWGGSLENWEKMVNDIKTYITRAGGRDYQVADAVTGHVNISSSTWNEMFGDLKG